jgi:hypothetical protein
MPVVTLTSVPEDEALGARLLLLLLLDAGSSAVVSSAGGVAVLAGGVALVEDADVDGVAEVEGGVAGSAFGVCAKAGAVLRARTAAAAKARRLFIGMHAPICAPPHPAIHNTPRR